MKLVIESAHVRQVTMVVGNVELPLTREQVVAVLFGDDYIIVRADGRHAKAESTPKVPGRRPGGRTTKGRDLVFDVLSRDKRLTLSQIAAEIEALSPGLLEDKQASFLSGILVRLLAAGEITRTGSRGSFVYGLVSSGAEPANALKRRKAAKSGEPSFTEMAIVTLSKMRDAATGAEVKDAIGKRYPGAQDDRDPSSTASALGDMVKMGLATRKGTIGAYRYTIKPGWEKIRAKQIANTKRARVEGMKKKAAQHMNGAGGGRHETSEGAVN